MCKRKLYKTNYFHFHILILIFILLHDFQNILIIFFYQTQLKYIYVPKIFQLLGHHYEHDNIQSPPNGFILKVPI